MALFSARILFAVGLFSVVLSGCNYQRMKNMQMAGEPGGVPTDPNRVPSTFAELQSRIFLSNSCMGCHGPGGKSGIEIHSYSQVMNYVEPGDPESSLLYIYLESGEMPPGPNDITGKLLEGVQQWILSGASENETTEKSEK